MDCDHEHDHDHGNTDAAKCWYRGGLFVHELTSHLPFSILSVTLGLMLAGLICFLASGDALPVAAEIMSGMHDGHAHEHAEQLEQPASGDRPEGGFRFLFHLFHPAHMLFSAAATALMFMRYDRNWAKAAIVGLSGAVVVCGISDIVMPHCSALIMNRDLPWHICVIEHPMLVLPFAVIGVIIGLLAAAGGTLQSTIFSHSMHVFASTMASIFYLIGAFGRFEWISELGMVFMFICLAVVIPCCLSDIVYPLLFTPKARKAYSHSGHVHPH